MLTRTALRRLGDRRRQADRRYSARLLGSADLAAVSAVAFGLLLTLVEGQWRPLWHLDTAAAHRLHEYALRHREWTAGLRLLSDRVWAPVTLRTAVAVLTAWLLYRRAWRLAAWAVVTTVTGGLVGLLAKSVVERARPALHDPVAHAPGYSFPSGHATTATTCFAVFMLVLAPLVPRSCRTPCWCVAAFCVLGVGLTRIALGVHWFSDVLGGWILGLAVVALTVWAFEAWRVETGWDRTPVSDGLEPELSEATPEPGSGTR
ncbi:phosphatase PAP2 family protein [Streptomyces adustus]|uniref:Phosphatase PAP2 family protein n=1 Tax=Streptomyces adustus TaxID=1609272 RepID=A0A5N8VGE5_9ACTN|nr:phosphatase PAP2 family protein [Streptomyces adustus]MPY34241.1 phosphatase PAP2 family protein [Streptomyces adustus]